MSLSVTPMGAVVSRMRAFLQANAVAAISLVVAVLSLLFAPAEGWWRAIGFVLGFGDSKKIAEWH